MYALRLKFYFLYCYIYTHIHIHIINMCMSVCVCMYARIYVCMYVRINACMQRCAYIYIYRLESCMNMRIPRGRSRLLQVMSTTTAMSIRPATLS